MFDSKILTFYFLHKVTNSCTANTIFLTNFGPISLIQIFFRILTKNLVFDVNLTNVTICKNACYTKLFSKIPKENFESDQNLKKIVLAV